MIVQARNPRHSDFGNAQQPAVSLNPCRRALAFPADAFTRPCTWEVIAAHETAPRAFAAVRRPSLSAQSAARSGRWVRDALALADAGRQIDELLDEIGDLEREITLSPTVTLQDAAVKRRQIIAWVVLASICFRRLAWRRSAARTSGETPPNAAQEASQRRHFLYPGCESSRDA